MARRGDGIGIEVTEGYVRAVRCAHDVAGQVAASIDLPRRPPDVDAPDTDDRHGTVASDVELVELFVQVAVAFGDIDDVPTRIAWFPGSSALRAADVPGLRDDEDDEHVEAARRALLDEGAGATLVVGSAHRPRVLGFHWDLDGANTIAELARAAGFCEPAIEPSPLSLARAAPRDVCTVGVTVGRRRGWSALLADRIPVLAASNAPGSLGSEAPALVINAVDPASVRRRGVKVAPLSEPAAIAEALQVLAADGTPLRSRWLTSGAHDGVVSPDAAPGAEPDAGGERAHRSTSARMSPPGGVHLDRPERYAVALGAALAAARLLRAPLPRADTPSGHVGNAGGERPWAVERRADPPPPSQRPSWWRRALRVFRVHNSAGGRAMTEPIAARHQRSRVRERWLPHR